MDFNLSTYYNGFDVDREYSVDLSAVESRIESATTSLAHSVESICHDNELMEDLVDLAHGFPQLSEVNQRQVAYLLTSSFHNASHQCMINVESGDFVDTIETHKSMLERYGYLIHVLMNFLAKEDFPASSGSSRQKQTSVKWTNNCALVEGALDSIVTCFKIVISKLFVTTPERLQFLEMLLRPIFHLMELPDRMKVMAIKILSFRCIGLAVTMHSCISLVQNSVIQSLTYYAHLPAYMAELLHYLNTQHDHIGLTEELLREISSLEFNSNDSNGPKFISEFLIKLSELSPRLILKQISSTAQLLDNSNQSLRCSVVETCGNIVVDILKAESAASSSENEQVSNNALQLDGLLNLLQDRFLDQNPFVRTKAIQAMVKICSLPIKMPKRRLSVMLVAVRSLGDRSTLVRRNSIKLMYKLLLSHPFSAAHGTQLQHKVWKKRLEDAELELEKYLPKASPQKKSKSDDMEIDDDDDEKASQNSDDEAEKQSHNSDDDAKKQSHDSDDDSDIDHEELNNSMMEQERSLPEQTVLIKAKLTVQYYQDALEFIEAVQQATAIACQLLFSKNRNEVLESMDFLVLADAYDIENAPDGIRRMLHLVWMKGSSDEGKSISSHLIDCYKDLFLSAPSNATASQTALLFAKNLIGLTFSASVADLASLEKLLCLMYEAKLIHPEMIRVLWAIYNKAGSLTQEYSMEYVHGAIKILGMLSLADTSVVKMGMDSLLNIGLGDVGKNDMVICKHTCATLAKIVSGKSKSADASSFAQEDEAIQGLSNILLLYTTDTEWYGVAEQALNAIFKIASNPEEVCTQLLISKSAQAFEETDSNISQVIALSQLVFIVGHVALKTIEHLEKLETQFKKQKHEAETRKSAANKEGGENELEMIGGTTEDDFTDAVIYVKERELLYGEKSLLAKFGPMVKEICSNNQDYDDGTLQRSATLCLGKLMCISSKFCEDNLPLLITIMEKSPDPIIRSNCVLSLGDMAVCFNNLIDENTDFLYRRLTDENIMVQKTCLMTVTFLILAGQVKVKGQLSSMAKCLENEDQGISDMCRLFFTELATKDNAIYNGFIDIFSGLSNDSSLAKDSMKRIVKFLVGFIEKEKHQKQLAEKLLVRLMKSQTESQWNDVAYVLGAMQYKNDNITQALEGGFKMVSARD